MNPIQVQGAWRLGWTLDLHTLSSEFLGYDPNGVAQFETRRSPLGDLLYQLKYRGHSRSAPTIAAIMADFLSNKPNMLFRTDMIVPIPPSTPRTSQPVAEIARALAKKLKKPVLIDAIRKSRDTPGLKDIHAPEERRELLDGAFNVSRDKIKGRGILLIDDLYRSGATANAVSIALLAGGASHVYFLAVTRTRRHS